jgi:uroporphyrinogen-III synthase
MRIVVTRPEGQEVELVARLEQLGHDVVHCPLIAIEPLGGGPIDVTDYDWIVLTSANGAQELRRRLIGTIPRVAAIGTATADAFGGADLVPAVATQEGLLAELPRPAGRVLFAAGEGARRLLPEALAADVVTLYRTHELRPAELPAADIYVVASPSSARALAALGPGISVVSIGPETSREARRAGLAVAAEAEHQSSAGIAVAVAGLSNRGRRES